MFQAKSSDTSDPVYNSTGWAAQVLCEQTRGVLAVAPLPCGQCWLCDAEVVSADVFQLPVRAPLEAESAAMGAALQAAAIHSGTSVRDYINANQPAMSPQVCPLPRCTMSTTQVEKLVWHDDQKASES